MKDIILASGSPRRKELFDLLDLDYRVEVSNVEEIMNNDLPIEKRIEDVAYQKGKAVFSNNKDSLVVSADTVVVLGQEILGKPKNEEMCKEMMRKLSNKTHLVITGFSIFNGETIIKDHDITKVHFVEIPEEEIEKYVLTKEPYDKAGGYAIQGWAAQYIDYIEGDYHNVMGLPLCKINSYLRKILL